jgi:DNA-binding CsgD family transcriptional regulator/PAS domain-containing protein
MSSVAKLLPVIRCLFDAATDGAKWHLFLKALANCFGASGAHIIRINPVEHELSFNALYGYDQLVLRKYGAGTNNINVAIAKFERDFERLAPTDPRIHYLTRYPGRPISCRLAIAETELHNSKVYKELLQDGNVEYSLLVSLPEDDGSLIMLGAFRGREGEAFTQQDTELFSELIPYLKQAIGVSEHLARADFSMRVALEALDFVSVGIIVVDKHARMLHANAAARRIAAAGDGIVLHSGGFALLSGDADQAARRAIWNLLTEAQPGKPQRGEAFSIARPSGKMAYPLVIGTLWGNSLGCGGTANGHFDRPLAVLFVTDPEEPQETPVELLRRLFGLTLTEAKVCERLAQGEAPDEIADTLEMARETVRVHLKNIYGKLGVSRQAELVSRILSTPVWMRYQKAAPTIERADAPVPVPTLRARYDQAFGPPRSNRPIRRLKS